MPYFDWPQGSTKGTIVCLCLLVLLCGSNTTAQIEDLQRSFLNPPDDARIMMRWWWFGVAAEKPEILRELQQMKADNIGGVELAFVYPQVIDDPAKGLVDDAFLRRIRHKVGITAPTRETYEKIFNSYARKLSMNPAPEAIDYLYERYYDRGRTPRASDCRDLLEIVQSICRYRRQPVHLTRDLMVEASASFIAEFS